MRAGRLVALILAVERRKGATARALAEELEVSERTIYRDVSALQAAGVPLWTEPGPGGGIRLVEGWSAPVDGLTADEATALFVGASGAADLGLGGVLAVARSKVRSALPPVERAAVDRVRARVHLDAPGWFRKPEELPAGGAPPPAGCGGSWPPGCGRSGRPGPTASTWRRTGRRRRTGSTARSA